MVSIGDACVSWASNLKFVLNDTYGRIQIKESGPGITTLLQATVWVNGTTTVLWEV